MTVNEMLSAANLGLGDIDLFVMTENSRRSWQGIVARLGIEEKKVASVIHKYGNTMSAMLPILLDEAFEGGVVTRGARILFLSVGEGLSGGGIIYRVLGEECDERRSVRAGRQDTDGLPPAGRRRGEAREPRGDESRGRLPWRSWSSDSSSWRRSASG